MCYCALQAASLNETQDTKTEPRFEKDNGECV